MATTRIAFNTEAHHRLLADGKEIKGGQEDDIDSDVAAYLAQSPWANVTIVDPSAPKWPKSHDALDSLAEQLGVTFPEPAEGKQKLTVAEKQAALEDATAKPDQPPAEPAVVEDDDTPEPEHQEEV